MPDDPRIPVILLPGADAPTASVVGSLDGAPPALVLAGPADPAWPAAIPRETFAPDTQRHRFGCTCCAGRSPAALALDRLFQARARGRVTWFARVLAPLPDDAARATLITALTEDVLTRARFRLEETE